MNKETKSEAGRILIIAAVAVLMDLLKMVSLKVVSRKFDY